MRIFLGGSTFVAGNGGIARVATMCAQALCDAGYHVDVGSFLDGQTESVAGRRVKGHDGSKFRFLLNSYRSALTHTHFLYDALGVSRAHPRLPGLKRPYAVWIHGWDAWDAKRPDYAAALRDASMVFANSKFTLDRCEQIHGRLQRAWICPLATLNDEPGPVRARFDGVPTALIVGRIDLREGFKGHTELLECWPAIVAQVPEARLVIAGGGSGLERLRARVSASPVAASIDVLGFVPESEIESVFRRAHVFAMPSRQEGFGIVYIEAMRLGIPVIASVHDAGQEVNRHGETGFNVDLNEPGALTRSLVTLLKDRGQAEAMGQRAFDRWQTNFRFDAFSRTFLRGVGQFLSS